MLELVKQQQALLWFTASFAWLGSVQFGFHLGILNTCLSYTSDDLHVDENVGGAIAVSACLVGAAVGAFCAGQIADASGPKRALQLNNLPLLLGCVCSAIVPANAAGFWAMLLGK